MSRDRDIDRHKKSEKVDDTCDKTRVKNKEGKKLKTEKIAPEPRSGLREFLRPSERESPIVLDDGPAESSCD